MVISTVSWKLSRSHGDLQGSQGCCDIHGDFAGSQECYDTYDDFTGLRHDLCGITMPSQLHGGHREYCGSPAILQRLWGDRDSPMTPWKSRWDRGASTTPWRSRWDRDTSITPWRSHQDRGVTSARLWRRHGLF